LQPTPYCHFPESLREVEARDYTSAHLKLLQYRDEQREQAAQRAVRLDAKRSKRSEAGRRPNASGGRGTASDAAVEDRMALAQASDDDEEEYAKYSVFAGLDLRREGLPTM
jgi:hypothetical protein